MFLLKNCENPNLASKRKAEGVCSYCLLKIHPESGNFTYINKVQTVNDNPLILGKIPEVPLEVRLFIEI